MENNTRLLKALSNAQIVMSVIFFVLGMVDGFTVRYVFVSVTYTPCWMTALVSIISAIALFHRLLLLHALQYT